VFRKLMPSLRRTKPEGTTELNLTPIMNLMVVLIPLLLSVAEFTKLALLEYMPPAEAAEDANGGGDNDDKDSGNDEEKETYLRLLINLTAGNIIQVSMYGKLEEGEHFYEIPAIPEGYYNLSALGDSLYSIKVHEVGEPTGKDSIMNEETILWEVFNTYKVKDGREVSITALGTIPFQTIINVMDVCRYKEIEYEKKELFPLTLLKQFQ